MGRKPIEMGGSSAGAGGGVRGSLPLLVVATFVAFAVTYTCVSVAMRRPAVPHSPVYSTSSLGFNGVGALAGVEEEEARGECCRGTDGVELWGSAVKWGTDFKFNSSRDCCKACKDMCRGVDGPCLCDSWVFCGDRERCGDKFGECWLKKQKDVLVPSIHDTGEKVIWTSGLVFGKGEGIIGLETDHGVMHIKLFPECAPHSVAYILELLKFRHCAGCQLHRAESRGDSWDSEGNHVDDATFGPPFGLLQGTLEAEGIPFNGIEKEACPLIRRGSVAWIDSGPEFIISLANHDEWSRSYTVFGSVLPEDMHLAEEIADLPIKPDNWNNVNVSVLEQPLPLKLKKLTKGIGGLNHNADSS